MDDMEELIIMRRNLRESGYGEDTVNRLLQLHRDRNMKEKLRVLREIRASLTAAEQRDESKLECIQFLIWRTEKQDGL